MLLGNHNLPDLMLVWFTLWLVRQMFGALGLFVVVLAGIGTAIWVVAS